MKYDRWRHSMKNFSRCQNWDFWLVQTDCWMIKYKNNIFRRSRKVIQIWHGITQKFKLPTWWRCPAWDSFPRYRGPGLAAHKLCKCFNIILVVIFSITWLFFNGAFIIIVSPKSQSFPEVWFPAWKITTHCYTGWDLFGCNCLVFTSWARRTLTWK